MCMKYGIEVSRIFECKDAYILGPHINDNGWYMNQIISLDNKVHL